MEPKNNPPTVRSEIALFLQQWDKEMESIRLAVHGYAITARHDFISQRLQSFADKKMKDLMELEARKLNLETEGKGSNTVSSEDTVQGEDKPL